MFDDYESAIKSDTRTASPLPAAPVPTYRYHPHTAHERSRLPRRRPANSRVAITIAGSRMRALSRSTHSEGFHDTHFSHVERSKNNPIQEGSQASRYTHHGTDTCHDCETIAVRTTRVGGRGLTSSVSDSRITSPHLPARARELAYYLYKNERKGHISTTTTLLHGAASPT